METAIMGLIGFRVKHGSARSTAKSRPTVPVPNKASSSGRSGVDALCCKRKAR